MISRLAALGAFVVAVSPAAADAPRSLRMRPPAARVAQVPPDGTPSDPPPDGAPGDPPFGSTTDAGASTPANAKPAAPPPPPASAPVEDSKSEIISVTGSTTERELFTGRTPVSVVTRADIIASGRATLGDVLQSLPAQGNAGNAQVNEGGDGTTRINLRGLGAPRTLVLLNGRRIVNSGPGTDAAVDINSIPLPMIERVEVVKDGASVLYGADAVGGVVNIVTRPQFEGTDASLLTSTSQHGDGTEYDASVVSGFTTSDRRTYLVMSAGYQHHDSVFAGDRAFSTFQKSFDFASKTETRNASLVTPNGRLIASSIGAGDVHPMGCTSDVCQPTSDGGWTDFQAPRDLYNENPANYLYTPSERLNLFATAGNRLTDNTALVVEFLYGHRTSDRQLSPVSFSADSPISKDSLYNPFGGDILDYRRRFPELGPRRYLDTVTNKRVVLGITGRAPASWGVLDGWKGEVSYNYGATDQTSHTTGQLLRPHVADALGPSMIDAEGVPICVRRPGDARTQIFYNLKDLAPFPCVPLNILLPAGTIPQDQLKNLTFTDTGIGADQIQTVLATASGRVAELPNHGNISLSLGADYRKEDGNLLPLDVAAVGYTTDNFTHASEGQFQVFEGFGEASIVPISGHEIAKWVELDLGARALRHDRYGSSLTYKAGALVRTVGGLAARATYATAFRTPSLPDTFGGSAQRTPVAEDPCDTAPPSVGDRGKTLDPAVQAQCTAQGVPVGSKFSTNEQISLIGGNPKLKPETAGTASVGLVFEPPQLPGLALTVDYWRIGIKNAIETLGVQTIFANCYERGLSDYCDQIHRDPVTHEISPVDQLLQNVRRTITSGIDAALWYDLTLAALGRIHTGFEAQYLRRYDLDTGVQVLHGVGFYDLGVYPHFKANLSSNWVHPSGASGGFVLRFIGTYKECADNDCNNAHNLADESRRVARYAKLDLFGAYDFRSSLGKTTLQIGVNNVFDATPPVIYNAAAANSDAATYDFLGRMAYVRLSQLF